MSDKRETPLSNSTLEEHRCTVDIRLEKLGMVPFFRDLSEEQLRQVNNKFSANHFPKGETVYRQGEISTFLRVLVAGNVKLVTHTMDGESVLLDMLQPGDFFGNPTGRSNDTYNETAETQTAACILSIRLPEFRELIKQYPPVAVAVLDITTERLNKSRERIQHLSTLPVTERLAHILVTLAKKFGQENSHGLLIQIPLSRKDLADMAGTSTETTSRIMSRLQEKDIVKSGRRWVAIKNMQELIRISSGS